MSIAAAFDPPKYEPKPGSVAQRAIAHLETLEPGASLTSAALAEALGVQPAVIGGSLEPPLRAGVLLAHQKGGHVKSPRFWALAARMNERPAESAGEAIGQAETPRGGPSTRAVRASAKSVGAEVERALPAPAAMRIALWSDGTLQIQRDGSDALVLMPDETRQLVAYLDRLAPDDRKVAA